MSTVSSINSNSQQQSAAAAANTTTSSASSSSTKSKTKYQALDINNIYKGKSLENPKTSVVVPKHGLQSVGKVALGCRRVPASANLGNLSKSTSATLISNNSDNNSLNKSNNSNLVSIVPSGGQGWASSFKEEYEVTKDNSKCPTSLHNDPVVAAANLYGTSPTSPTPSSQNVMSNQQDPFLHEFPPISVAGSGGGGDSLPELNNKHAKENSSRRESLVDSSKPPPRNFDQQQPKHLLSNNHYPSSYEMNNFVPTDGGGEKEDLKNRNKIFNKNSHLSLSSSSNFVTSHQQHSTVSSSSSSSSLVYNNSNTNSLFALPTNNSISLKLNDINNGQTSSSSSSQQYSSGRRTQYPQQSNYGRRTNNKSDQRRYAIEKPAIIDDQELKNLDNILTKDIDCDWAMEHEIDFSAKLEFSDNSDLDEEEDSKVSGKSSINSYKQKQSIDTKDDFNKKEDEDFQKMVSRNSRESSSSSISSSNISSTINSGNNNHSDHLNNDHMSNYGSHRGNIAPPPPPPQLSFDSGNRYYGRKSDSLYDFNRKENELDKSGRRNEYHSSSRSQQLSRTGNNNALISSGISNQSNSIAYQQPVPPSIHSMPNINAPPRSSHQAPQPSLQSPGSVRRDDENWRPKRLQDEVSSAMLKGRQTREIDDSDQQQIISGKGPLLPFPPASRENYQNRDRANNNGTLGSQSSYMRQQAYSQNLPPRLQKQIEFGRQNNNVGNGSSNGTTRSNDIQLNGDRGVIRGDSRGDYSDRHNRHNPDYDARVSRDSRYNKSSESSNWRVAKPSYENKMNQPPPMVLRRDSGGNSGIDHSSIEQHKSSLSETDEITNANSVSSVPNVNQQEMKQPKKFDESIKEQDSIKTTVRSSELEDINSEPSEKQRAEVSIQQLNDAQNDSQIKGNSDKSTNHLNTNASKSSTNSVQQAGPQSISSFETVEKSRNQQNDQLHNSIQSEFNRNMNANHSQRNNPNNEPTRNKNHGNNGGHSSNARYDERAQHRDGGRGSGGGPHRKYSNSDRYTPPSNTSTNNNSSNRRDSYRTSQIHQPQLALGQNESSGFESRSQESQQYRKSSDPHTNGRPRNESFGSNRSTTTTPPVMVPSQSPGPVPPTPPQQHQTSPGAAAFYPSAPGSSNIRASTTYGPPTIARAFNDVIPVMNPSAQSSNIQPPVQQQTQKNERQPSMHDQKRSEHPPVSSNQQKPDFPSTASSKQQTNQNRNQLPMKSREKTENRHRGQENLRGDRKHRNNPGASVSSSSKVSTLQKSSNRQNSTQPLKSGHSSDQAVLSNANASHPANATESDLNNDEWETASESSDLQDRSSSAHSQPPSKKLPSSDSLKPIEEVSAANGQNVYSKQSSNVKQNQDHRRSNDGHSQKSYVANSLSNHSYRGPNRLNSTSARMPYRNAPPSQQGGKPRRGNANNTGAFYQRQQSQDILVNQMSKMSFSDNYNSDVVRDDANDRTRRLSGRSKGSSSGGAFSGASGQQGTNNQQQRPTSNDANMMMMGDNCEIDRQHGGDGKKRNAKSKRNKEVSKSKNSNRGNRTSSFNGNEQKPTTSSTTETKDQPKSSNEASKTRNHEPKPKSVDSSFNKQVAQQQVIQQQTSSGANNAAQPAAATSMLTKSNSALSQVTKSISFEQHDSGIESGDQPPSSSASTSQRSSPSNGNDDANKVVVSSAPTGSNKLITTSSSSIKCTAPNVSQQSSGLGQIQDSQKSKKNDQQSSLSINKIPDMADTSTNIHNRKIVGTLVYENSKLREEKKKGLPKIDEVSANQSVTMNYLANSNNTLSQQHLTTSAINEELNQKIASVKKVWDTAPPNNSTTVLNQSNSSSATFSNERKSYLLSGGGSVTSPTDKKSVPSNQHPTKHNQSSNIFFASSNSSGQLLMNNNANVSPPIEINRSVASAYAPNQQQQPLPQPAAGFHQNPSTALVQTPTSPPTMSHLYSNSSFVNHQQNLAAFQYGQALAEGQISFGPGAVASSTQPNQPMFPQAAFIQQNASAQQNHQFSAMATMMASQANLLMAQFAQAQHPLPNDHQYNKFALSNANVLAQQNLMKPFVHNHQSQAAAAANQMTAAAGQHLQQSAWPAMQQQTAAAANQHYLQLAATTPHFVPNPLTGSASMMPSTSTPQQQVSVNQTAAFARQQLNQMPNISRQQLDSVAQNRSFINSMNDMHHHHHSNPISAAHHPQMPGNPHFVNEQANSANANTRGQQSQQHNTHRNQQVAAFQQGSSAGQVAANMTSTVAAAANWPNQLQQQQMLNQQMFFGQKLANGRQIQPPFHLIQPMLAGQNQTANAMAAAVPINSRKSPLAGSMLANPIVASGNYPNPIQRPIQNANNIIGMKGGNQANLPNHHHNNRNGLTNNKSMSSSNMNKSKHYNNNNRNSTTPSPGTNNNNLVSSNTNDGPVQASITAASVKE